jgi:hypothetical protein
LSFSKNNLAANWQTSFAASTNKTVYAGVWFGKIQFNALFYPILSAPVAAPI